MIWAQVLIVAWLLRLLGMRSRFLGLLIALTAMVPVYDDISLAMALRGLWGDPSITSMQLLQLALIGRSSSSLHDGYRTPLCIAAIGVALYASALGPWDIDLYRLGYQPSLPVIAIGFFGLVAWWRSHSLYLWVFTFDLLAWRAGVLETTNLWDYLVDPVLVSVMLLLALRNGYRDVQTRRQARSHILLSHEGPAPRLAES